VLAKIVLPSSSSAKIMNSSIDVASVRRVILSAAVMQEQIVNCCCGPVSSSGMSFSNATRLAARELARSSAVVLNVAPGATAGPGQSGVPQFAVTVINSGVQPANDVVLTVDLSPQLDPTQFTLSAAQGWATATLAELRSTPIRLAPGKAQTFSFQVAPVGKAAGVKVVLTSSAVDAASGVSHAAAPLDA